MKSQSQCPDLVTETLDVNAIWARRNDTDKRRTAETGLDESARRDVEQSDD